MDNIDFVYTVILNMFSKVITWLKMVPVFPGLSLFEFCICILVMSITISAFVSIVTVSSSNYFNSRLRSERRSSSRSSEDDSR